MCKNNGVLFENQLLQIGVKSEFRQNLGVSGAGRGVAGQWGWGFGDPWAWAVPGEEAAGSRMEPRPLPSSAGRMYLFYGNKTSVQFQNFSPTVVHPGDLQTHILRPGPAPSPKPPPPGLPSWPLGSRWSQILSPVQPSYWEA